MAVEFWNVSKWKNVLIACRIPNSKFRDDVDDRTRRLDMVPFQGTLFPVKTVSLTYSLRSGETTPPLGSVKLV